MRLGGEDRSGLSFIKELVGDSEREWLKLWHLEGSVEAPEDWIAVVNEVALTIPGTLAYRAQSDARMPARFRTVAPNFESLGWRIVDADEATRELTQILAAALLGESELRSRESAAAIATAFVALFGEQGEYLTNVADPDANEDVGSTDAWATACPFTPAVAEAGIIAVGGARVGLLWALES